jgi:uncharacterized protein with PIN domain
MKYSEFKAKYAAFFNHPINKGEDYYRCVPCNTVVMTVATNSIAGEIERLDTEFGTDYFQADDIRVCMSCGGELETEVVPDADEIEEIEYFIERHTVAA